MAIVTADENGKVVLEISGSRFSLSEEEAEGLSANLRSAVARLRARPPAGLAGFLWKALSVVAPEKKGATREEIVGGRLEVGTAGMARILATFDIVGTEVEPDDFCLLRFQSRSVDVKEVGKAAEFRVLTADERVALEGAVGTYGSGASMLMDKVDLFQGITITMNEVRAPMLKGRLVEYRPNGCGS